MSQSCINGPAIGVYKEKAVCAYRANDSSKQLYVTHSRDGVLWTSAYKVPGQTTSDGPAIASFKDKVYIAYKAQDGSHDLYITYSTDLHTWTYYQVAGQSSSAPPCLGVDDSGKLWMAYRANDDSYELYVTYTTDGLNWTAATPITGESTSAGPAIAQFNEELLLVFKANDSSDQVRVCKSTDGGVSWHASKIIAGVYCKDSPTLVVRPSNKTLYMAFQASNNSKDIYVAMTTDAKTWTQGPSGLRTPDAPRMTVFFDMLLMAYEGTGSDRKIWWAGSQDGTTWQQPPNPATTQKFYLAFTADPQLPWVEPTNPPPGPTPGESEWDYSVKNITAQYQSINYLAVEYNGKSDGDLLGVVANGDLTAFGDHDGKGDQGSELDGYKEILKTLEVQYFLGLGNHDYDNNVNDSFRNHAASGMVDFMFKFLQQVSMDYDFSSESWTVDQTTIVKNKGSLAYSFDIGPLHVVQMHNYPSYVRNWERQPLFSQTTYYYEILSSMSWLEDNLKLARAKGSAIVLCFHDYGDKFPGTLLTSFNNMVSKYKVSALFVGHIHQSCGFYGNIGTQNEVPVFRCGAPTWANYVVANFDFDALQFTVTKIDFDLKGIPTPSTQWVRTLRTGTTTGAEALSENAGA